MYPAVVFPVAPGGFAAGGRAGAGADARGRSAPRRRRAALRCLLLPSAGRGEERSLPTEEGRGEGACPPLPIEAVSRAGWVPRSAPLFLPSISQDATETSWRFPGRARGLQGQALSPHCCSEEWPGLQNEVTCRTLKLSLSCQTLTLA